MTSGQSRVSLVFGVIIAIVAILVFIWLIWRMISFLLFRSQTDDTIAEDLKTVNTTNYRFGDSEMVVLGETDEEITLELEEPFDPEPSISVINEYPERYLARGVSMQGKIVAQLDEEFYVFQENESTQQILLLVEPVAERSEIQLDRPVTVQGTLKRTQAALKPYPATDNLLPRPHDNLLIIDVSNISTTG